MPPPNGNPARRRPTGQLPSGGAGARARRPGAGGGSPRTAAGAKLVCTAGPAQGQEFSLEGDEVVIGRSSDNAVSIPDTSVSRKHVLLRQTPEGWAASDMGSGNGTMVNGAPIAEETPLSNGDLITLGDTELRLEEEGARRPVPRRSAGGGGELAPRSSRPVPRSRARAAEDPQAAEKRRKLFIRVGAVVGVLMLVGIGLKVVQGRQQAADDALKRERMAALGQLQTIFQEGKNLVREGKWVDAKAKFDEVLSLNPEFGAGAVQKYLERTEKEIPNQQRLDEATEALKANEVAKAAKALAQVTQDTQQYERRDKLRSQLEGKMKGRIDEARLLMVETKNRAKMVELQTIANDILGALPDQRDALEFKKVADESIDRIDHPPPPPTVPSTPWLEVQRLFASGDKTGALATANACAGKFDKCRALMKQIQDFDERSRKVETASAGELLALLELDKRISGGDSSPLSRNIGVRVVSEYYKKASSAKAKGDWGAATENARRVLAADPGHNGAQAIMSEARKAAQDVYLKAYQLKDSDPDEAAVLFKQVVQMTLKDDEYHQKAQRQLAKKVND